MKNDDSTVSDNPTFERRAGSARTPLTILGIIVVAFAAFVGVRVSGALGTRASNDEAQKSAAEASKVNEQRPPTVEIVRGRPVPWQPVVSFEGSLSAQREADLGFKVPGRLHRISAKVGDKVGAGRELATLDPSEADAQLNAAKAQLAAAEAQAALASDAARRTAQVVESGAQSEASGVQAEKQRQLAEAQMNAARAQSELARTALGNHNLTAPFAGTITKAPTAPGAVVAPGVPLFHLADLSTLKLVGTVGAEDARFVRVGTPVEIKNDDGKTVVARGKISAVVPALDPTTKRLPVEATIANDKEGTEILLAGSIVRAELRGSAPVTVLSFPHTVLRPGSQNEVLVVRGGKLAVRSIDHAVADDGSLLVRSGVRAEDNVVLAPWPEAHEGQAVTIGKPAGLAAGEAPAGKSGAVP